MDNIQFKEVCKKPIEINDAHQAISRFCSGKGRMCIPVRPDDDDILLCRAIDELGEKRTEVEKLLGFLDEIDTHLRATKEPMVYILETMRSYFNYQMGQEQHVSDAQFLIGEGGVM